MRNRLCSEHSAFRDAILAGVVICMLLIAACQPNLPTATPTPPPTSTPVPPTATALTPPLSVPYTPGPQDAAAPIVVQRTPEAGERLNPDGAIELVFDRPMNQASVANAFTLRPALQGSIDWMNERTFVFKPAEPLPRNTVIDVALTQSASASDGTTLREPYQFRFVTQGNLEVGQTIPASGAQEIDPETVITVIFNRPVVPLTTLNEQSALPQPLSFDPPIEGEPEWLNTSVLAFRPKQPLPGGTTYTALLSANLKDTDGNPLAGDYRWTFSTAAPKVISVSPDPQGPPARVDTPITVQFNQDVDAASARAAFQLLASTGTAVSGEASVLSDTLTFTPSTKLAFDGTYTLRVAAGVLSRNGGDGSQEAWQSTFRSVPLPRITGTQPADGAGDAVPGMAFIIYFNTDIDPATVVPHLSMTPVLSPALVYTYYNTYDHSFILYFGSQAATDYVADISPGIADPYGNLTQEALRVAFHTGNLAPGVYIQTNGVATLNAYQPARLAAGVVNVSRLDFELRTYDASNARFLLQDNQARPAPGPIVRQWQQPIDTPANKLTQVLLDLAPNGGQLKPGAYQLRIKSPDISTERFNQEIVLVVSEVNLTLKSEPGGALVWATDLQSGKPVSGLTVNFSAARYKEQLEVTPAGTATTDANGVAQVMLDAAQSTSGYYEMLAITGERFSAVASNWQGGISAYSFDLPAMRSYGYYGDNGTSLRAYLYTDRPIYRPGQQVFVRGIVRREDDVAYSLPASAQVIHLRIDDAQGNNLLDQMQPVDAYGAFQTVLTLAGNAPLGSYNISADANNNGLAYTQFSVSAYRPPEYEVLVSPGASELARGQTLSATIEAHYLSGGGLRNRPVTWNVLATQTTFDPPQLDEYTFSDSDDPWYCFDCFQYPGYQSPAQPLMQGSGNTDELGRLSLSLPISLELRDSQNQPYSGPLSLSIEAVATGADNQPIAGRSSVMLHPASYYIGIAFSGYMVRATQPATVSLVSVDWAGQRLADKTFDVLIYRREWQNSYDAATGQWRYATNDELITSLPATSDARGEAQLSFVAPQAGTYHVVARGEDEAGRRVQSGRFLWATGEGAVSWLRENNDRIHLIANQSSYLPGQTADILIPSPFSGTHYALVTVERGHILQHDVIAVSSSSQVYHLPLQDSFTPNVYVSVVLFQGGQPDFKVGYVNLPVQPVQRVISITLTPAQSIAQPGEMISYTLQATDSTGQPVSGQFSLDLVDKGILNLLPRTENAIVQAFYSQRGTRVQTAAGLSVSGNRVANDAQQLMQRQALAYDTAKAAMPAATAAPAVLAMIGNESAASTTAPSNSIQVREDFADTAYWAPNITTDAQGRAVVSIKLPDNLTTWVVRAVGVDAQTRVGEGTVNVIATKPLLIRPVTPRFLVVNDVVQLGAVVNNNTMTAQTAVVALSQAGGITLSTPISQQVTIPAQGEAEVHWTASVGTDESVNLVFSVANDAYADASRPRLATAPDGGLKVNRYSAPEVVGTAGELDAAGGRTEVIALPPRLDTTQGELTVRLEPSLAASMQAGLTYLENDSNEHAEAVLSRFLPNVLNYQALQQFSIRDAALEAKLQTLVSDSLAKLYTIQNGDGGWAWWSDLPSNPHISAYVVFGMLRARQAGFTVSDDALQRGLAYLRGTLKDTDTLRQYYEFNQQAYVLYVLGESGQGDANRVGQLYDARDKLSLYARALVALSIGKANPQDARLKTLFADLNGQAIQSATGTHWEEQYVDWWAMNTDTRSTAIILSALATLDPTNKLAPNVVRWLMMARTDGIWHTTQETAWSLIALTDWVRATGELQADYDFQAILNEQPIASGQASAQTLTQTVTVNVPMASLLRDVSNRLNILRGDGPGRLYYTAHLKAYLPVPSIKAVDRGIQVLRRYTRADCTEGVKCPEVTQVKVGDVIRVNLTLIAPGDLYYVQLEDPLPAGADIVDTALATTSQIAEGPALRPAAQTLYRWWWYWYSRTEMRDDRVVLYANQLGKGTYEYSYTFRATSAGQFNVIPAFANEQYFPEVFGRSDGMLLEIGE